MAGIDHTARDAERDAQAGDEQPRNRTMRPHSSPPCVGVVPTTKQIRPTAPLPQRAPQTGRSTASFNAPEHQEHSARRCTASKGLDALVQVLTVHVGTQRNSL